MRHDTLLMVMLGVIGIALAGLPAHAATPVLPPATGSAGLATLEGIDSDQDGIRDDIQRYIVRLAPASTRLRKALSIYAMALQGALLVDGSAGKAAAFKDKMERAEDCVTYLGSKNGPMMTQQLKGQMLNTRERNQAYTDYNMLLRGPPRLALPFNKLKARCDFNPDALPD